VRREELNLYLDSLLALAPAEQGAVSGSQGGSPRALRRLLIGLAEEAESLPELIREWLFELNRGSDAALEIRILFQLRYQDLGEIFNLSFKEITQLLRSQRAQILGAYLKREDSQAGGVSCFLVDQLLSPWVDSEWDNLAGMDKLGAHLFLCSSCAERLQMVRDLNAQILKRRVRDKTIAIEEWRKTIRELRRDLRRRSLRVGIITILILSALIATLVVLIQRPEKTPNIYEITEP
jgi:hypothetical protein